VPAVRGTGPFEIVGASADKPIAIRAKASRSSSLAAMMVKVFRLTDYTLLSLVVEWPRATAHWRADIYSKVTGVTVSTELVDLVELERRPHPPLHRILRAPLALR
jgi:hypothetical protein